MDQHVPAAESEGLRRRGVDVLTAQEAGMYSAKDEEHLAFALSGGRVIFTQDSDFLRIHAEVRHTGLVYAHQQMPVGDVIRRLMLIVEVLGAEDMVDHLEFV